MMEDGVVGDFEVILKGAGVKFAKWIKFPAWMTLEGVFANWKGFESLDADVKHYINYVMRVGIQWILM